jgi:hypothetical protein
MLSSALSFVSNSREKEAVQILPRKVRAATKTENSN